MRESDGDMSEGNKSAPQQPPLHPIAPNPGGKVDPEDHAGHTVEQDTVLRACANTGALLTGDRRMGKTSLLNVIEESLTEREVLRLSAQTSKVDVFLLSLSMPYTSQVSGTASSRTSKDLNHKSRLDRTGGSSQHRSGCAPRTGTRQTQNFGEASISCCNQQEKSTPCRLSCSSTK